MNWIDFFIKPLLVIFIADLSRRLYSTLNYQKIREENNQDEKISLFSNFKLLKEKNQNGQYHNNSIAWVSLLIIITNICGIIFFPLDNSSFFFNFEYSIVFILAVLIITPLYEILISLSSKHPLRIQTAKFINSKIIRYYFPIIISVISLFIMVYRSDPSNSGFDITFESIIRFQTQNFIDLWGFQLTGMFIFINPFSFIAYMSAIIGLLRDTNLDALKNQNLRIWDPIGDLKGRNFGLIQIARSIQFFLFLIIIVPLFLGTLWIGENLLLNILVILLIVSQIIVVVALFGQGKPRIFVDRKLESYLRTPLLFSLMGLIFALVI
jgi:NADH:ubiquinone oxidoreductase subunit H